MHRILLTGFCALPGPHRVGVQLRHVMASLARRFTVDALVSRHGEQAYVERQGDARILRVPLQDPDMPSRINAFRRALKRQLEGADYDTVHFRDGWSGLIVLEQQQYLGYRTVFDVTRAPLADAPVMDPTVASDLARAEKRCLMEADHVLVPSRQALKHVASIGVQRPHIVPPGVDVNLFDWEERGTGLPVILYAGTVEPGRGVRVLLRAMMEVVQSVDARLVIAGAIEPGFQQSLEVGIRDLELDSRVELRGEVEHQDMPELIAQATACVVPSACESRSRPLALYPTKLLEYMACRRVVVAPRRGTVRELIHHRREGLLFTPGDPMDLAEKLVTALRDAALRTQLARAGYDLVRENHTASALRRSLRKAYAAIMAPSQRGSSGYTDIITDETLTLDSETQEVEEITETSRVERFQPGFPEDSTQTAIVVNEVTDETTLPLSDHLVKEHPRGTDGWVVSDMDDTNGWRSLLELDEGTPIDGVRMQTPPSLLENRFVSGEIDAPTPAPVWGAGEDNTSFTAVSVLLGSVTQETDGSDREDVE